MLAAAIENLWSLIRLDGMRPGRSRRRPRPAQAAQIHRLESRVLPSVAIKFDYRYDTGGFFSVSGRKTALNYAGNLVASRLTDTLSAISESGGNSWTAVFDNPQTDAPVELEDLIVPVNRLVVFVGARDLPGSTLGLGGPGGWSASGTAGWLNTVRTRGNAGVDSDTDFAPWGGTLTFDEAASWHFGRNSVGLDSGDADFISVATHEIMHLLGIGTADSWDAKVSDGLFTGAKSRKMFGSNVPVAEDLSHWAADTASPLDSGLEAAMDPSITLGTRKFPTQLDFAGLDDIGWTVSTDDNLHYQAKTRRVAELDASGGSTSIDGALGAASTGATTKDVDFYRVYFEKGTRLMASVGPRPGSAFSTNTFLKLFRATGTVITTANQGGSGGTDSLTWTVTRSDYYWVGVATATNSGFTAFTTAGRVNATGGDYRLTLSDDDGAAMPLNVVAPETNSRSFFPPAVAGWDNVGFVPPGFWIPGAPGAVDPRRLRARGT